MRLFLAAASLAVLSACASTEAPTETSSTAAIETSAFSLAMDTVTQLTEAGNEQIAIDRLTQLLGDPSLTDTQKSEALLARAQLRYGAGNDVLGALEDLNELTTYYPTSEAAVESAEIFTQAQMEADGLLAALDSGMLSPTEEFEALFRLGRHQDAADLMLSRNLQPEDQYIVDMFQIGYLCDDPALTGPSYPMTEPDGTARIVRFCEFGK